MNASRSLLATLVFFSGLANALAQDPAEPDVIEDACGWVPETTEPMLGFSVPDKAGCGLAPQDDDGVTVVKVNIVGVFLDPKKHQLTVHFVLLDAEHRRVTPRSKLRYDFQLKKHHKGVSNVRGDHHDGIYTLEIPKADRPEPCELQLFLKFDNGTEVLETWVDDWLYAC